MDSSLNNWISFARAGVARAGCPILNFHDGRKTEKQNTMLVLVNSKIGILQTSFMRQVLVDRKY